MDRAAVTQLVGFEVQRPLHVASLPGSVQLRTGSVNVMPTMGRGALRIILSACKGALHRHLRVIRW